MKRNATLNDKAQMERVWDIEIIKDLMSRRTILYNNEDRAKELETLWVREPDHMDTASYGSDWGYYVGMSEIRRYYIYGHNQDRASRNRQLSKIIPSAAGKLDYGCVSSCAVNTPFVVIADDGNTGKGLFYSIGQETIRLGDGSVQALWLLGKIGADFIKENGIWKIWNLVVSYDVFNPAGKSYAGTPIYYKEGENPIKNEFGNPTIPMLTHDEVFLWLDDYPFIPHPYESYTPEYSYGPWGHPNYREVQK